MDEVEETCFLEITQVFSSSAETNEKKLVLTLDDVNTFRSVLDQLNEFQHLLQDILVRIFTVCALDRFKTYSSEAARVLIDLQIGLDSRTENSGV